MRKLALDAPRPSSDELAKLMRETSPHPALRPPAPEPAHPWDDAITEVVTITDPVRRDR
jgi:hypothetical protein